MRQKFSSILFFYLARNFLRSFLIVFALLAGVAFLIDLIEVLRHSGGEENASWSLIVLMTLYKMPGIWHDLIPFTILLGTMATLVHFLNTGELIALRAGGISVWQFLLPGLCIAFIIGIAHITILNPIISFSKKGYENLETRYLKKNTSDHIALSDSGLWLREDGPRFQAIIHMEGVLAQEQTLINPSIFLLDNAGRFHRRIDGENAVIHQGYWLFPDAWISMSKRPPVKVKNYRYRTHIDFPRLYENFAAPESFTFWQLPGFISLMDKAGLSAKRHKIYYYSLLVLPFFLISLLMIGAAFSLRLNRRTSRLWFILIGVSVGFAIYFINNMFYKLALSHQLPIIPALTAPLVIGLLLSIAFLLHTEDG